MRGAISTSYRPYSVTPRRRQRASTYIPPRRRCAPRSMPYLPARSNSKMTIPALTDATRSTPPSRKKTWATFLTESLEQSWREDEWDPNEYEFTGMLNSAQTGLSVCLRDGCETVVDHGVELCSACTKAKRNLPPGAQLQPRKLNHRRRQNPKSAARFSLASLGPVVRDEILYGLQDRDRRQLAIRPFHVRQLIKKVPVSTGSLLELSDSDYSGMQRSLLRSLQQSIRRLDM